ncbi:MAG: threonylcarbamoyl-AMP synthase [Leptospira sp.]|nr:threonylcarbamoyl-AMP synthase [Leptospira sp.]
MILQLHPVNPDKRKLKEISGNLIDGAVYIFPTDTVYALAADSNSKKGIEKLYVLKEINKNKPLSILCPDISTAASLVEYIPNEAFKLMKRITPGPFTFIFRANRSIPRVSLSNNKNKNIGIRIPENKLLSEFLSVHPGTITTTSVFTNDEYMTDIDDLENIYGNRTEGIIDGGIVKVEMSTVIDFTTDEMILVREGKGAERI